MATEAEMLERWFVIADANHDGRIEGAEAITFFQRSGLPRETLKEVWGRTAGAQPFMTKQQFYGAIRLVSLAQLSGGSFTALQAQQLLTGTAPPPPLPKLAGLTSGSWTPPATSPTFQHTGGSLPSHPIQHTGGSLPGPPRQATGGVPFQHTGGRPEATYPPLPLEEATRYGQLFQSLDTDQDGVIQGGQCIELFSSRGVDRGTLKQIWQVVAGHAGHINRDQFVKCLYLIETTKQGIPIPVSLPSGVFPVIVQGGNSLGAPQSMGTGGLPVLPNKAVFPGVEATAYPGWRGPSTNEAMVATLDPTNRDRLLAEKAEAQKKDQQLYMMNQEAEAARNKKQFYERALQELMLFKSRMDVASMETQEQLRREQEHAAEAEKRYEQIRYGAEEAAREAGVYGAALQEARSQKTELEAKLNEMEQEVAQRELAHPEMVRQIHTEIQGLQEGVAAVEMRRNKLTAELESYKQQHELLTRRQGDLQMASAAAEAEVNSAAADIEKIMTQVETAKQSSDVELIQKLLRESARVYSNLHSNALKAGVEIPLEARLSLYGDDVTWSDDLIGAGFDLSNWQEDGFVHVDAFPDVKEDMDAEFERAIQEAVGDYSKPPGGEPTSQGVFPIAEAKPIVELDFGGDPFQSVSVPPKAAPPVQAATGFESFVAFEAPVQAAQSTAFAVSFDEPQTDFPPVKDPTPLAATVASRPNTVPSTPAFETDFADFGNSFSSAANAQNTSVQDNKSGDLFGDSAFP